MESGPSIFTEVVAENDSVTRLSSKETDSSESHRRSTDFAGFRRAAAANGMPGRARPPRPQRQLGVHEVTRRCSSPSSVPITNPHRRVLANCLISPLSSISMPCVVRTLWIRISDTRPRTLRRLRHVWQSICTPPANAHDCQWKGRWCLPVSYSWRRSHAQQVSILFPTASSQCAARSFRTRIDARIAAVQP